MNCQEVTRLLDDGDVRNVPPAKRRELDAHLSGCADCAAEWRVQERIVMTPAPLTPPGFVTLCRQLVAAGVARLMPRSVILYGTVLALAAAAAMLAWRAWNLPASPAMVAAMPIVVEPARSPAPVEPDPAQTPAPAEDAQPAPANPQPLAPPPGAFSVAIPPLQLESTDLDGHAMAVRFRERVMALLHGVPNLVLAEDPVRGEIAAADYEVRMKYTGSTAPTSRTVYLEIQSAAESAATRAAAAAEAAMNPEDRQRSQLTRLLADASKRQGITRGGNTSLTLLLGRGTPTLTTIDAALSPPGDRLETAAQNLVRDMRINVFPLDESFEQAQLAVLTDPAQRDSARMRALGALLIYAERRGGFSHATPEVVRAGGELALTWEGPTSLNRLAIWDGLALTGSPELIPYLVRGLNESPHTETRLRLVKILAGTFADEPRASAALAAAAESNDQQTVRMAAMRETGNSDWGQYLVETLQNSSLPDVQRLQPIADMAPGELGSVGTSPKSELTLKDDQLRELGRLIIRMAPDSTASETVQKALFAAGAMETPGALDMLINVLQAVQMEDVPTGLGRVSIMGVMSTASGLIAYRYAHQPKARAFMEQLAKSPNALESRLGRDGLLFIETKTKLRNAIEEQQPAQ